MSKVPITSPHPTNKHMVVGHIPPQCLLEDAVNQALLIGRGMEAMQFCWVDSDIRKARAAKEREKHTLKPHRDHLVAEADEFWEDWRRLYWQRVDIFGDASAAAAVRYVRDEMTRRNAEHPKTGKVPSKRICHEQLLREPTVDWRPEPIHCE